MAKTMGLVVQKRYLLIGMTVMTALRFSEGYSGGCVEVQGDHC
jgi:hypothetical protein